MTIAGGDDRVRRELFENALAEAEGDDARSVSVLSMQAILQLWDAEVGEGLAASRSALERAEGSGEPHLVAG